MAFVPVEPKVPTSIGRIAITLETEGRCVRCIHCMVVRCRWQSD